MFRFKYKDWWLIGDSTSIIALISFRKKLKAKWGSQNYGKYKDIFGMIHYKTWSCKTSIKRLKWQWPLGYEVWGLSSNKN